MFDEHAATRQANGSKGGRLFRNADDPNEMLVLLQWDDLQKARQFAQSDDLRETMQRAGVAESGLLSYGGDMDDYTNPFEVRLGKYVDLDVADDVVGIAALRRIQAEGPTRQQLGVVLEGAEPTALGFAWHAIAQDGHRVGHLTNCVWSWRLQQNIGFALIARRCTVGETVEVIKEGRHLAGTLTALPFL